ncbi:hypothetical protein E1B28_003311 [Marasmius oreades]|uniref:DUF6699 domain-containing protein n=1 Tax=Marasmius oreades TaxID=181124 RepID=A0A9P7RLQ0_9AGAR|nr:uncharacterized protein E1B28_003311 [Marasmius oreades]KAG7085770.1 hypothetical protein E1B28_003311 [Marasmius oreades]
MNRLFRSSERKDYPKTPKISSIALPPSPTSNTSFVTMQSFMMPRNATPAVHNRSATPVSSSGRRHTIPDPTLHHRTRTNSTSSHGTSEKPIKGILKNSTSGMRPAAPDQSSGRQSIMVPPESQSHRERTMSNSSTFSSAIKPLKSILKKTTKGTETNLSASILVAPFASSTRRRTSADYSVSDTEAYTKRTEATRASSRLHKPDRHYPDVHSKPLSDLHSKYADKPITISHSQDEKAIPKKGWETPDIKKMNQNSYNLGMALKSDHLITSEPLKLSVISLDWVLVRQDNPKKRPLECYHFAPLFDMMYQPDPHPYDPTGSYKPGAVVYDRRKRRPIADETAGRYFRRPASSHCRLDIMHLFMGSNPEWKTTVHSVDPAGIRPIDVFRAIFDMLQAPLTSREMAIVSKNKEGLRECERFRDERIKTSPVLPAVALAKGCVRVDVLGNYRYFNGLVQVGDCEWIVESCHPKQSPHLI